LEQTVNKPHYALDDEQLKVSANESEPDNIEKQVKVVVRICD